MNTYTNGEASACSPFVGVASSGVMQCPDGTVLGVDELHSLIFGKGLHGLLTEAASDAHFSCSPGVAADGVTLTCLGTRPVVITFSREGSISVLHTGEALELRGGQEARIDIEGSEPGYTFIFNPQAVSGGCHNRSDEGPSRKRARVSEGTELEEAPAAHVHHRAPGGASPATGLPPAFSLLRVRDLPPQHSSGMLGTRLADVLGGGHVRWMLISNYMIDVGWLLSAVPSILAADRVVLVHGERNNPKAVKMMAEAAMKREWTVHAPPLRDQWGVHHSKAFLVEFDRGLRVIVMTANLIYQDCNTKTQGLWYQDFPRKAACLCPGPPSSFEVSLGDYVCALKLPAHAAKHARDIIAHHDFSSARAHLVPSIPGYHTGADMRRYGHMRVRHLLRKEEFQGGMRHAPLVAQFSSMGSITPKWLEEFQHSFWQGSSHEPGQPARPLGKPEDFSIVWPTVESVKDSNEGWFAGCSIPGSAANVLRAVKGSTEPILKPHWCVWTSPLGRQHAMPHIKTYLRHRGSQIAFLVMTSHNLSKAAWGTLQKSDTQLYIMHYELGVLLLPSLELAYRSHEHFGFSCTETQQCPAAAATDKVDFWAKGSAPQAHEAGICIVELPVPYELPPQRYKAIDEPWRVGEGFAGLDSKGCTIQDSYQTNSHYGHEEPPG